MFRYSDDVTTYTNDRQFMWGESIMIAPVLDQVACAHLLLSNTTCNHFLYALQQ